MNYSFDHFGGKQRPTCAAALDPLRRLEGPRNVWGSSGRGCQHEAARRVHRGGDGDGKAPATVNRALGTHPSAFRLAQKQGRLSRVPYFPMLREDNARQGFFVKDEFEAVAAALSETLADVARFAVSFFCQDDQPVGDFRKAWATACMKAEVPGRLFHDLRYKITSTDDKRKALTRTDAHLAAISSERNVAAIAGLGQDTDDRKKNGSARES
jgi:hypothetical protein